MNKKHSRPVVYVFIGPEKTGTTTIFDLLPFDQVPLQKEMFNLSRRCDSNAELARIDAQLSVQNVAYIVEPTYFVSDCARQILSEISDRYEVHVIHTRRDPIDRMISHYLHHKAKGRVSDPEGAVASYPEIVGASHYDEHTKLWREVVEHFHVIDVTGGADLSTELTRLGITPSSSGAVQSNLRMAPRNFKLARLASKFWQVMIDLRLNKIVPSRLKNSAKARVYYGGQPVEVSDKERECLIRMLSTID
ncbi:hypothetical protein SAMN05216571_103323 [Onishia taeanensis]|uniref:Sulfotransferase family protein n=1 Tax=Onishia taeanensis TaxID=284577 RepID=A0A1G7QLG0_9GAMM|nr:hypothetical protein [Halomonas taeanensis]SDF99315.1 hypothetical protein SAMN05216571_103323 [Halomonas taeanensis]